MYIIVPIDHALVDFKSRLPANVKTFSLSLRLSLALSLSLDNTHVLVFDVCARVCVCDIHEYYCM